MRWTFIESDDDALIKVGDVFSSGSFFDKDALGVDVAMDQKQPVGLTKNWAVVVSRLVISSSGKSGHPGYCGVNGFGSGSLVGWFDMASD